MPSAGEAPLLPIASAGSMPTNPAPAEEHYPLVAFSNSPPMPTTMTLSSPGLDLPADKTDALSVFLEYGTDQYLPSMVTSQSDKPLTLFGIPFYPAGHQL